MKKRAYIGIALGLGTMTSLAFAMPAFAETTPGTPPTTQGGWGAHRGGGMGMRPAVFGTVTAIDGNTITVTGKQFTPRPTGTPTPEVTHVPAPTVTYSIDATNAKITKNNTASTVSSIIIGDTLAIQGTVDGTNVTATMIRDGVMMRGKGFGQNGQKPGAQIASQIQGNGSPVIAGTVSSVSGSVITITNKSNTSYTIETANAKIYKGPNIATISDVTVGDSVIAQGSVSGTSITASTVIDHQKPPETAAANTNRDNNAQGQARPGLWGRIGNFFRGLF